ncbi:MAG: hypothetical protein COV57_00580 [Candidatus Liptonbacteria bacterium CG11_big_fil_rev_8_21_14_0_20_35_14]|uniref:Uncharacterized protein n=1 Tax=Candidatus Liptonbacteria bacterium CG11_big_fil_rev_8_21_14_0_20_35_14 TaxID=1974634 RepID=A0A2H0N8E0_9BACT|nr:MAG: hypothetical protein COV57_00580 [Candidatus Liptonbacteria bacterium CG11_big_fil_rev_8_21_14_0_20_35_14]
MPDQFNNSNNISAPNSNQVPPSPSGGSVDIRTQASDINSIKQNGGASPAPAQFNLGGVTPPYNIPTTQAQNPPGGNEPVFNPNTPSASGAKKIDIKKLSLIGISLLILIILGWVGYAYIYPIFFPAVIPSVVLNDIIPPLEEVIVEEENTPQIENIPYVSLLDFTGSSGSYGATLSNLSNDLINFSNLDSFTQATNFNELIINNANNQRTSFAEFLNSALGLDKITADDLFETSLTSFIYLDQANKLAVGYIGKIKEASSPALARDFIKNLESSNSLINIFTSNSIEPNEAGFKDGQVNSLPARYLLYSNGDALDYFWSGNHIVITTSYNSAIFIQPKLIN